MFPLYGLAQSNPWIVSPHTLERSGGRELPERRYTNEQYNNGYDAPLWGRRPAAQATRRNPDFTTRQRPRNERRDVYGPFANERWTGTPPQNRDRANLYGYAERRQASSQQYGRQNYETGPLPSYRRQGRLIPNFAVGQFGRPQPRRSRAFMQYPPAGYDPSRPPRNAAPRQWQGQRERGTTSQGWPPQRQPQPYSWSAGQPAQPQRARRTWPYRAPTLVSPSWSSNRSWSATPPWAVNPGQNGYSQGFKGPSTFGNPFGSPFGGLSGPFGTSNGLGLPPGGMW